MFFVVLPRTTELKLCGLNFVYSYSNLSTILLYFKYDILDVFFCVYIYPFTCGFVAWIGSLFKNSPCTLCALLYISIAINIAIGELPAQHQSAIHLRNF